MKTRELALGIVGGAIAGGAVAVLVSIAMRPPSVEERLSANERDISKLGSAARMLAASADKTVDVTTDLLSDLQAKLVVAGVLNPKGSVTAHWFCSQISCGRTVSDCRSIGGLADGALAPLDCEITRVAYCGVETGRGGRIYTTCWPDIGMCQAAAGSGNECMAVE